MRTASCNWLVCSVLLATVAGCGGVDDGFSYQPVSGRITVDGTPQAGLTVTFVPQSKNLNSGRPSVGVTDQDGRYEAHTIDGRTGAALGEHIVSISSEQVDMETQDVVVREEIPLRYNKRSTLRFTVPSGGTEAADFMIESGK